MPRANRGSIDGGSRLDSSDRPGGRRQLFELVDRAGQLGLVVDDANDLVDHLADRSRVGRALQHAGNLRSRPLRDIIQCISYRGGQDVSEVRPPRNGIVDDAGDFLRVERVP